MKTDPMSLPMSSARRRQLEENRQTRKQELPLKIFFGAFALLGAALIIWSFVGLEPEAPRPVVAAKQDFDIGQDIFLKDDGVTHMGTIINYSSSHNFPNAKPRPAYCVDLLDDSGQMWMPIDFLEHQFVTR